MIKVSDKYYIGADAQNIILFERETSKRGKSVGKDRLTAIGYFNSLQAVLRHVLNLGILETQLKDLMAVEQGLATLRDIITKLPSIKVADLKE